MNLENAGSVIFAYGSQGRLTILAKSYVTIIIRHTFFIPIFICWRSIMLNFLYKNHIFFKKDGNLQIKFDSGRVRIVWEISVSVLPLFNFLDFDDLL